MQLSKKLLFFLAIPLWLTGARMRPYPYKAFKVHPPHRTLPQKDKDFYPKQFIKVPLVRQSTNWTCGVASLMSVLAFFGIEYREDILAHELQSNSEIGTNYKNIVSFAQHALRKNYPQATVVARNGMTLADLETAVTRGNLVQVAFQAWADDPKTTTYATDNDDGHYSVVIGFDEKNVYFMDPSTIGNYTYIPKDEFMQRWHDVDGTTHTPVINFGIEFSLNGPYFTLYQSDLVVKSQAPSPYPRALQTGSHIKAALITLPKTFQPSNWTSQLTCLQSILYYYGVEYRPDQLAEDVGITANTLAQNQFINIDSEKLVAFAREQLAPKNPQMKIQIQNKMTIAQLQKIVAQKNPILVECEPWVTPASNLNDGRYMVIIGFDRTTIIAMDPSTLGNYVLIDKTEFEKRWKRTGIIFSNGTQGPTYHPDALPKLE